MPGPEGYRKAQRLMRQAEKFGRPVITFVDTPGAYPGPGGGGPGPGRGHRLHTGPDERAPGACAHRGDRRRGKRRSPGVGGGQPGPHAGKRGLLRSLARGVCGHPLEGCRPQQRGGGGHEADRTDLKTLGVVDEVIPEPPEGAHACPEAAFAAVDRALSLGLEQVLREGDFAQKRYEKFRGMGAPRSRREAP